MRRVIWIAAVLAACGHGGAHVAKPPTGGGATQASVPEVKLEKVTLKNGLEVYLLEDHRTPMVYVVTGYQVGSKDEHPGRTGFAHLFEHLMFEGSPHAPKGVIDNIAESAGGWTNAWTSFDETVYEDLAASNFLDDMLWLEGDRLAGLADALDQTVLDNQRDVVRNERRQSYENRPYGMAELIILKNLWPDAFPYHWPTIGFHEDLVAASLDDVKAFFHRYYLPNNAFMVIAGDIDPAQAKASAEKYLGWIPRGEDPPHAQPQQLPPITKEIDVTTTDNVQVPRVYENWRGPIAYSADEAPLELAGEILAGGKSSRLYKRLVYDEKIAQDVSAGEDGNALGGMFQIVVTAKPGVTPDRLKAEVDEEVAKLAATAPTDDEVERAKSSHESEFLQSLEDVMARATQVVLYRMLTGDPDYFAKDVQRFRAVTANDVKTVTARYLTPDARVVLTINPAPDKGDQQEGQ